MFRAVCVIMAILLVACIAVQYNDPDGATWMIIYAYGLVMAVLAYLGKHTVFPLIGFIGYLNGFFHLMPSTWDGWIENEMAREALGSLFAAACMLILTERYFRGLQRRADAASGTDHE